jgi:hypothetical protein
LFLIGCTGLQLDQILEGFSTQIKEFPCRYLGLPLHSKKLRKIDFLPLIDKLPTWKGKFMSKAARTQLIKSVLTVVVTYRATVFNILKWLIKKIDKLRRKFYCKGKDTQGNKGDACLVKWDVVCRQKDEGGLGIHNLKFFGRALRQQWLWYH